MLLGLLFYVRATDLDADSHVSVVSTPLVELFSDLYFVKVMWGDF